MPCGYVSTPVVGALWRRLPMWCIFCVRLLRCPFYSEGHTRASVRGTGRQVWLSRFLFHTVDMLRYAPAVDAGKNGEYYVPNATTGNFDIYQDGKKVKDSGISWRAPKEETLTAVYNGNKLTLSNVTGGAGAAKSVEIQIGAQLGTLAFIPSKLSNVGGYPTTDKPFYNLNSYLSEAQYVANTYAFIPQTAFDKSNVVGLEYRVSPQDAYISAQSLGGFINRAVTRAEGDANKLMNVASFDPANASATGVLNVNATFNKTAVAQNGNDIAAFQLWNGQVPFTSDYVAPSTTGIDAFIVNPVATKADKAPARYYARNKAITASNKETDAFVKQFVKLADASNLKMTYDVAGGLNLNNYVDLYTTSAGLNNFLSEYGFTGMSYTFSLPESYLADDAPKTNQQWFVSLSDDGILTINTANLTDGLTPAIGRTPVVRVDAFVEDNYGVKRMVASSYIKIEIVRTVVSPDKLGDLPILLDSKNFSYPSLTANGLNINTMSYQDVNNKIYGATGMTSSTFWQYYGGADKGYKIDITVNDHGTAKSLYSGNWRAMDNAAISTGGVKFAVTLGEGNTQTSQIKFDVNNAAKTEITYGGTNGAEYTITITIPANDNYQNKNVVVTQKFYVKAGFTPYDYNPLYYTNFQGKNCVVTKGTSASGFWKLQMNIEEAFKMINNKDIYQYATTQQNVDAINFALLPVAQVADNAGVAFDAISHYISLVDALTKPYKFAEMQYTVTFVNAEKTSVPFTIAFQNPFIAGSVKGISISGTATGEQTVSAVPSVNIVDLENKGIYAWSATANKLVLSALAQSGYKLTDDIVSVKYTFVENDAYKAFKGQLAPNATFNIVNGVVTYNNFGASLANTHNLSVKAVVTFKNISEVECIIPLTITGRN